MQKENLILGLKGHPDLQLRVITKNDIEDLRNWKNSNKTSFFLNQDITPEQQTKWFTVFSNQEHEHMFIVEQENGGEWKSIGCMGFRKLDDEGCTDAYNIIRSQKIEPASFTMSDAFGTMLAYAASLYDLPVRCKVLSVNPAVEWYKKNDFSIVSTENNYYLMELDKSTLRKFDWFMKNNQQ
ncbi:MAG: GNAT family N-acetyltransferase [Chitinophagaceae bacterium]